MKKTKLILAFMLSLGLASCRDTYRYYNDDVGLQVAATYSLIGVRGTDMDGILVLDEDAFGRKLYAYVTEQGFSENPIVAMLISQRVTKTESYIYDSYNFIVKEIDTYHSFDDFTIENINLWFSQTEVEILKTDNDWDKPLREDKLFRIRITRKKEDTVTVENQKKAMSMVSNFFDNQLSVFLSRDDQGMSIYAMCELVTDGESKMKTMGSVYVGFFNINGNLISSDSIVKIENLWEYSAQLRALKGMNGWSFYSSN